MVFFLEAGGALEAYLRAINNSLGGGRIPIMDGTAKARVSGQLSGRASAP